MNGPIDWILLAAGALITVPIGVFFVECLAALLPRKSAPGAVPAKRGKLAVLIPAHNEEQGIVATLESVRSQLTEADRVVVVADNCTDGTAAQARAAGAIVLERIDPDRRGKGFALSFGLEALESDPPDVVILMDADTTLEAGSLEPLYRGAASSGRPVQGIYLMDLPSAPGLKDRISSFAFLVKNLVRPLGLARLGGPCLVTGPGIALPWESRGVVRKVGAHIVEDMQMGVEAALAGTPPVLCPEARVTGRLPSGEQAARIQRTRWEHGHLGTFLRQAPRLMWGAVRRFRPALFALALDLSVPPLALLCLLWIALSGAAGVHWVLGGSAIPAIVMGANGLMIALAVLSAWARHGRDRIPFGVLAAAPLYVFWKLPIYVAFLFRRQKAWVRTPR